jgi:hypothetical protein
MAVCHFNAFALFSASFALLRQVRQVDGGVVGLGYGLRFALLDAMVNPRAA